jgi:ATP-dependent DNA helicase RecG
MQMQVNGVFNLRRDVEEINGISQKYYECFKRLGCNKIIDLLFHFPVRLESKIFNPNTITLPAKSNIVVDVEVFAIERARQTHYNKKKYAKIICKYGKARIDLVYFNYFPNYINFTPGKKIRVAGECLRINFEQFQMSHPTLDPKTYQLKKFDMVYPLTYGLTSPMMQKIIQNLLVDLPELPEWHIGHDELPKWSEAVKKIHNPESAEDIEPWSIYKKRLAYDELLASQIAVRIARTRRVDSKKGNMLSFSGSLIMQVLEKLGFKLTKGQEEALREIIADQKANKQMMRLLQGDVGCGKTLVALCAMLNVKEANGQSALMAPTDILARQHYQWLKKALSGLDIKLGLLTGKTSKQKKQTQESVKNGEIDIIVGTHALFQEKVEFSNLKLAIIDEQHRFGVQQRINLLNKGQNCDCLLMSATPIPRTLALTIYGDMDVSSITDKPAGRKPIVTNSISNKRLAEVINAINRKLAIDQQVYWICPLIEEKTNQAGQTISEISAIHNDNAAVEIRYKSLLKLFPEQVGLLHGKLKQDEKEKVMEEFLAGKYKILVATTVVEVGVDVPNATLIVIEDSHKFGLAQLHQLRGRVGRSDLSSNCILIYPEKISKTSYLRLKTMRESNDGFYIAEQDLKLRGSGDLIGGYKQSGLPSFTIADLEYHQDLLVKASKEAQEMLGNKQYYNNIYNLLTVFGYDITDLNGFVG